MPNTPTNCFPENSAGDMSEPDVVSEIDLDREATAGLGDSVRPGVHRAKPDQARFRNGLIKVVVEDRERIAVGRVVDLADGGVENRLATGGIDRPGQRAIPTGMSIGPPCAFRTSR